jgi:hypothetical protein
MHDNKYTFRDPVHGFIGFNDLEWDIINSPAFQRLRRIRQLAWTDYVYPGAMHTRFEHSMGVCHIASRLFDAIIKRNMGVLKSDYNFMDSGIDRQRQIIRLAALMHDLGHGPFSHASEEVFPEKSEGKKFVHEDYSAYIATSMLGDIIKNHSYNTNNFGISIDQITDIFSPTSKETSSVLWKEIISGQMDADRMDYLLRDSYHCGVSYGRYDLDRDVDTLCLCEDSEVGGHLVGVEEDGIHAVEGLLIARFMMFTQVYFHKTRVIFDHHYEEALKSILTNHGGHFPTPIGDELDKYFDWDDWKVQAELRLGNGGEHGKRLMNRDHYRLLYTTPEIPSASDLEKYDEAVAKLTPGKFVLKDARKSWYKFRKEEIRVQTRTNGHSVAVPLATRSTIVNGLATVNQRRIYVPQEYRQAAYEVLGRS